MRKNGWKIPVITVAAALSLGMISLGAEYTTPDLLLKLETPGEDWKQVTDGSVWVKLSDGTDVITLEHFSNGEKLPDMTVAEEEYQAVCQNVISTENEVFIITGEVKNRESLDEMREAVQSVQILKYDTKKAVEPAQTLEEDGQQQSRNLSEPGASLAGESQQAGGDFGENEAQTAKPEGEPAVEAASFPVWVTGQSLNVRSGASTETPVMGTVYYADSLDVTGIVMENGAQSGWYQVAFSGGTGYVSAQYVSAAPPTAEKSGLTLTDESVTLYEAEGDGAAYVYKATDGNWYDGSGRQYFPAGDGSWTCGSGSVWTEDSPASSTDTAGQWVTVEDEEGYNSQTLYLDEATGLWENTAGGIYTPNGDGTYTGEDGTIWYPGS